jgi:hypothetical protein
VPRHVARLVTRLVTPLVVDYTASRILVADYSVRRDFVLRLHWLYFSHVAPRHDVVFWSHRVDHSSRLIFQTSRERQSRRQQLVGINSN